jgi:hypothetical protein
MTDSRRRFIRNAALLSAGWSMSSAMADPLKNGFSKSDLRADKIRIGAIGINGMGWSDLNAMLKANPM